jgi:hypothetical protein
VSSCHHLSYAMPKLEDDINISHTEANTYSWEGVCDQVQDWDISPLEWNVVIFNSSWQEIGLKRKIVIFVQGYSSSSPPLSYIEYIVPPDELPLLQTPLYPDQVVIPVPGGGLQLGEGHVLGSYQVQQQEHVYPVS